MNPYNSIQLVGNELIIVADSTVEKNQISIKPDVQPASRKHGPPPRVRGTINGKLGYSVPVSEVGRIIVYMRPNDKLWLDPKVNLPVIRHAFNEPPKAVKAAPAAKRLIRIDYFNRDKYVVSATEEGKWSVPPGSLGNISAKDIVAVNVYDDGSQVADFYAKPMKSEMSIGSTPLTLLTPSESISVGL